MRFRKLHHSQKRHNRNNGIQCSSTKVSDSRNSRLFRDIPGAIALDSKQTERNGHVRFCWDSYPVIHIMILSRFRTLLCKFCVPGVLASAMLLAFLSSSMAQQKKRSEEEPASPVAGIELSAPRKLDMQFGMRFQANDNLCSQILATIAFPTNWPEQQVTILQSEIPPNAAWQFRDLPINASPTARQLVMQIPALQPGGELEFLFQVEVEKYFIDPPEDTTVFVIPKKPGRELNWAMGSSPMIDVSTSEIKRLAKTIAASEPPDAWTHVERIYDWVRENIQYVNGPIRNTREAMKDKKGDCEEMTGIFVAICRASGIPARCVWIPDHCYPEFYLEDKNGKGHWFPCQVAGDRQFGKMHDYRPILQKGDRFKVPEKQGMQHYLSEFFTCKQRSMGPREPEVTPILDLGPLKEEIEQLQQTAAPQEAR
jgi:hypothetical protein